MEKDKLVLKEIEKAAQLAIMKRYESGESFTDIAAEIGISPSSCCEVAHGTGPWNLETITNLEKWLKSTPFPTDKKV